MLCIPYLAQVDPGLKVSRETIKVVQDLNRMRLVSCVAHPGRLRPLNMSRALMDSGPVP